MLLVHISMHSDQLYVTFLWNFRFSTFTSVFQSNFKINAIFKKQNLIFFKFYKLKSVPFPLGVWLHLVAKVCFNRFINDIYKFDF